MKVWILYDINPDWDELPELIIYAIFTNKKEAEELENLMYKAAFHSEAEEVLRKKYNGRLESSNSVKVKEVEVEENGLNRDHGWVH